MAVKPLKPAVSSLSMAFRRAVTISEDAKQAKKEHRERLGTLIESYMQDVTEGKAEGIRNAKDLVEVMKMDMLLLGEATERKEEANPVESARVQRIAQVLDTDDPNVQSLINEVIQALNGANDDADEIMANATDEQIQDAITLANEENEEVEEVQDSDNEQRETD